MIPDYRDAVTTVINQDYYFEKKRLLLLLSFIQKSMNILNFFQPQFMCNQINIHLLVHQILKLHVD